jgi:uncharacterized protein involved in type VI secretion and phage assembly
MDDGLVDSTAKQEPEAPPQRRIYGVSVAMVVNNVDSTGLGRVQLRLPWIPGFEPWARVSTPMAGMARGTFFIPQIGDEVLVAFNHGDLREPYVVGSLWNGTDRPPATLPTDAVTKRAIRTPLGHQLEFDEALQTVTLTSTTQQQVELRPESITISTTGGLASITLGVDGSIKLSGTSVEIVAADSVSAVAGKSVDVSTLGTVSIGAATRCGITAGTVTIN